MVKKLAAFYGTERFITVFTKAPTALYPEQTICSYKILFLSGFLTEFVFTFLISAIHITCPTYLIIHYYIKEILRTPAYIER
jgi:hypothetical protein